MAKASVKAQDFGFQGWLEKELRAVGMSRGVFEVS